MSFGKWKAHIYQDPMSDPFGGYARLLIAEEHPTGRQSYVTDTTLVLQTVEEGSAIAEPAGINIPVALIPAILEAIERWQGKANHAATEVAVLREWLSVERKRVDALLPADLR